MGCSGCRGSRTPHQYKAEDHPEPKIPGGAKADIRGEDLEPCKKRYTTLVLEKDGTYRDYIICQNRECPIFNILSCPCDCRGCPWREE